MAYMLPDIFNKEVSDQVIARIHHLNASSSPQWGKMSVAQMLAHCCVTYEMVYTDKHPKPNFFMKLMLKTLVKNNVVNEKQYKHNSPTAPQFIIKDEKDFNYEKARLVDYIARTQAIGGAAFEQKESHSFGKLSRIEWNNMFYKHLDHHLTQFGV
jgi:hypothetical protein